MLRHASHLFVLKNTSVFNINLKRFFIELNVDNRIQIMSSPSCSICHEIYTGSDDVVTTPCGHIYHRDCLLQWFNE